MNSAIRTESVAPEVLPPPMTRSESAPLLRQARRHWKTGTRNALQFAADLRRLQDGGAHLARGFDNFGTFAEHEFDGLSLASAQQISRTGAVLLTLEKHGRIDLEGYGGRLPGTTGLRPLASILNTYGESTMIGVWDAAAKLRPGRAVVAADISAVVKATLPQRVRVERADGTVTVPHYVIDPPGEDDEGEDPGLSEEVESLLDQLNDLRESVYALDEGDPTARGKLAAEVRDLLAAIESESKA